MTTETHMEQWKRDAASPFEGWDFAYLDGRMIQAEPEWDYLARARAAVSRSQDILDMATGGGEVFASLSPFPGRATAVEGYAPNLDVARRRLAALGVPVFQANTASGLPFDAETFDLVLNRHGGLRPAEVHRVLKPGGVFLTQQVGGDNLADLIGFFGAELSAPNNTLDRVAQALRALGCHIRREEAWRGSVSFLDVGAIVYFLKAVPWVVQGFSPEAHSGPLAKLQAQLEKGEPLQFTSTRFLIEAVKT